MSHARHYIGWAKNFKQRMAHHRGGTGARFTQVAIERGIELLVARIWDEGDKSFERRLKNCKKPSRFCPICHGEKALENMVINKLP
jgi:predicted GIY-YIG superfamily endonuclease